MATTLSGATNQNSNMFCDAVLHSIQVCATRARFQKTRFGMSHGVFGDVDLVCYIQYKLVLQVCATPARFQKTRFGMSHRVFGDVDLVGYSLQGQSGIAYFLVLVILGVVGSAVGYGANLGARRNM